MSLLTVSCSRKKSTFLSRGYHNTTSRYNGYFNAREIMKKNDIIVKKSHVDDYSQVLPIFIYPDEKKSQSMYPDMDKIIEKCSQVIERHSIYIRKKENVKWIDDSYFLIAKARLYKREFGLAEETFLYVYQAFKQDPNRYQGLNWLIKTFIETEQWDKAEEFLDLAELEYKKYPEELKGDYYAVYADFYLKKEKNRAKAIEKLEDAIKFTKPKEERRRYTYILAQLYLKDKNLARATELYSQVIKLNPNYTMRFNARISRALAFDATANNSDGIKKELNKMLRDKKNEEFRDQIYFALAELALKEKDEPLAVDYLRKSVKFSVTNNKQKAQSYFKLAELYFARPDYVLAQSHYDSTLQFLPKDHPEYYEVESKNNNLQELVTNLKVIMLQDSLLALGQLNEKDRKKQVNKIIKKLKEEEDRKKQAEMRALALRQQQAENPGFNSTNRNSGRSKGQWYFYNVTTKALGLSEFKQVWGERKLEDNWNRKKSQSIVSTNTNIEEVAQLTPEDIKADSLAQAQKYDPEFYLKDIPVEMKDQLNAHGKLVEALFNVGTIFKESFVDYPSAIKSFKRITSEYDTSRYNLPAHYQLYRTYTANADVELAEEEKKWILENHPFSEYAYLIKNPNYNKESKETKQKVEEFYQATYKLYQYGLYADVITSCNRAETAFSKNHLRPQFAFMKAKSIGYTEDKETFRKQLEYIIQEFPKEPVKEKAQEILNFMNKTATTEKNAESEEEIKYVFNPKAKHIFVFTIDVKDKDLNEFKNQISDFNKNFFRETKLQITSSALNDSQLFLIRTFENLEQAARYYKAARNNSALMLKARQEGATEYLISNENFRLLFKSRNEQEYVTFFNENYPID
ncbi:MAG: hypothetical protein DWP98_06940 [Bacteroidetes bacterium]|nr:MAG: hypothetical protein DWP98_06940 [Bacteroidota bacterium]MBL1143647.1 hypothetical protein [Bacteroidota bacterium]MCB0803773.1 hypothetical protein [Flavobacteriales bacterium]NOG56449.1 hypothetical protein [Bacteroidota bacterium]